MSLSEEDKVEMANSIAQALNEHKGKKSFFKSLGWFYKVVLGFVSFCTAVVMIGGGVSWFMQLLFQDEIMEYEDVRMKVYNQQSIDSTIIYNVGINSKARTKREGSKFYAVGYRAEVLDDGRIVKYYRGWDGKMHQIVPDLKYSTNAFTYWIFHNEDGTKEHTFGK